jgi:hypothetical protein
VTSPVTAIRYDPAVTPPSLEPRTTWRFRLYPTAIQRARLDGHLRQCVQISNAALEERRDAWRRARVSIGVQPQSAQRPARWPHAYVVSTVGGTTLGVLRQDIEHQKDG